MQQERLLQVFALGVRNGAWRGEVSEQWLTTKEARGRRRLEGSLLEGNTEATAAIL